MKNIFICFVCLIFLAPTVLAGWTGATADRNISFYSADTKLAWCSRIAVGPEGNLYCVWIQGRTLHPYELYFGRSTDQGATWSSETVDVMINADDGQNVIKTGDRPLGMATNSQGDIFIVWVEDFHEAPNDLREVMLLKSTDEGLTWLHSDSDFNISYDGAPLVDASDPDIAVDNNDNLYVVWYQDIATADTSEIHISISTDGGDTWSGTAADRYISFYNSADANNPQIAIAPNNDIYVVWDEMATPGDFSTYRILYGKSTDGGATFNSETADMPISTQIRSSDVAYILIDDFSNVHVTWKATRASASPYYYEIFYSGSTDGGVTWSGLSGPRLVDFGRDDGSSANRFGMGVTSGGCLIVVWDEDNAAVSQYEIWASYSTDGGSTWSGNNEPELISFPDGRGGSRPDVIAGVGDTLHVIWNESPAPSGGNYYDIHYSKGDTLTFCSGGGPVIGRCCYNNNQNCVDTTEAACLDLGGDWDAGLNCIDNPCPTGGCDYVVGDVNGSDSYNGLDITYGVAFFKGGPDPMCPYGSCPVPPCDAFFYCGDVNASCSYNGLDITYGVAYFKGGPGPLFCADCPPTE